MREATFAATAMPMPAVSILRRALLVLAGTLFVCFAADGADARSKVREFASGLSTAERQAFEKWYFAQLAHDAAVDAYWRKVERKRTFRREVRRKRWRFDANDYVKTLPPTYEGPTLSRSLLARWRRFRDAGGEPRSAPDPLPGVPDYLAAAKRYYGFVPERIPEAEFKRRYAREALAFGLTKDQVVRIYALETGGRGTADMQAGIHPITGKGRPISSALGYAQLLSANTINVVSKHGPKFVERLNTMARRSTDPARRARLERKARALKAMIRTARSVPYKWSRHIALSRTGRGMGLHPLNIDGDIGPWLQIIKLAELKDLAASKGRAQLSGAEIELMNLAGPATGLEMMLPVARDKPTTNFFSRRAYNRNTIVRGRTAEGLLVALEERMKVSIRNDGAVEFARIFDDVLRVRRRAASND